MDTDWYLYNQVMLGISYFCAFDVDIVPYFGCWLSESYIGFDASQPYVCRLYFNIRYTGRLYNGHQLCGYGQSSANHQLLMQHQSCALF